MKTMIIVSSNEEAKFLLKSMSGPTIEPAAGFPFYVKERNNARAIIGVSGVGPVSAAICATAAINKFSPDCVIVAGTAGGIGSNLGLGDLVIADEVRFAAPGVHRQHLSVETDAQLNQNLKDALDSVTSDYIEQREIKIHNGPALTVCTEVTEKQQADQFRTKGVLFVEMEGYAVLSAADKYDVPAAMIRYVSDIPGTDESDRVKQGLGAAALDAVLLRFCETMTSVSS